MTQPSKFIQSSDYASIGSDGWPTITLVIPNSISIASGAIWTAESVITVPGTYNGKGLRPNVSYSKEGNYYYGTSHYILEEAASPSGYTYYILVNIYRKSATQIAMQASIWNQAFPATTITTNAVGGTITAEVRTLVLA